MALPVLVAVVAIGVSLIVLTVHLTGGTRNAEIASTDVAVERYLVDYPDAEPGKCLLSADRRDAIIDLSGGAVGLVHSVGSHYLTRHVERGEMRARIGTEERARVKLQTGDFTWPRAEFTFDDEETARAVVAMFDPAPDRPAEPASERAA